MTKKEKQEAKQHARKQLRKLCRPGTRVFTRLESVARSGMSRRIALYVATRKNEIVNITGYVARALDYRLNDREFTITIGGCGSDAGFDTVHSLSYALHGMRDKGDGALPENAGRPFTPRPGHYRSGYSLKHSWL